MRAQRVPICKSLRRLPSTEDGRPRRYRLQRYAAPQSSLNRLEKTLTGDETLQTASLDSLVLLLAELGQPIGGRSQIFAQHRAARDHLVLDCLLDQLVLTDAQSRSDLSGQSPKLFVTPTQGEYGSRCHASRMAR